MGTTLPDLDFLKDFSVLYVEDDEDSLDQLVQLLSRHCKAFLRANNGREGLEAFQSHRPDIVITDIRMPILDGLSMISVIRSQSPDVPIIILTAVDLDPRMMKAIEANSAQLITKPFDNSRLLYVLADCVLRMPDIKKHDESVVEEQVQSDCMRQNCVMGEVIADITKQWRQQLSTIGLVVQGLQINYQCGLLDSKQMEDSVSISMRTINQMSQTMEEFRRFITIERRREVRPVHEIVSRVLDVLGVSLRNHEIELEVIDEGGGNIDGYVDEYAQAVLSVVSYVKETLVKRRPHGGKIVVRCRRSDGRSVVTVHDNGSAMDPNVLVKLFEPELIPAQKAVKTGVGLYMSKIIIERFMGGQLTVGNLGDGVEFRLEV